MIPHGPRNTNVPCLTLGLEPDGNVHPVTMQIRAILDHIANVHANTEANMSFWRLFSIVKRYLPLHFDREAHSAVDAVKGNEKEVATRLI